ncbi:Ig domain-containing protein [Elysia marginata]|uniref:Ig domain-containing protein n=1 Tax=Elysia marginata TaxID=1093978 RepID=A0AAV4JD07_9GAST|nr:Ig domain-containing protein [Elysia marginata]
MTSSIERDRGAPNLNISYYTNSTPQERVSMMTFTQKNKVGIGTDNPKIDFEVRGRPGSHPKIGLINQREWDHLYFTHDGRSAIMNVGGAESGIDFRVSDENNIQGNGFDSQSYQSKFKILPDKIITKTREVTLNYGGISDLTKVSINTDKKVDLATLTIAGGIYVGPKAELAADHNTLSKFKAEYLDKYNLWVEDAVTGVTIKTKTANIIVGKTKQLTATVIPSNATNKTIKWESDHEEIATVSDAGVVRGLSAGEAIITVTTEDGNKTATATVTVKAQPGTVSTRVVTNIDISLVGGAPFPEKFELAKSGSVALKADITPSNKTVKWESDHEEIATVSNTGVVKGIAKGTVTITATSQDDTSKKKSVAIEIVDEQYKGNFEGDPYYYIKKLKTEKGINNIDYGYSAPSSGVDRYLYISKDKPSGGLKVSKTEKSFILKIEQGNIDAVAGVWIDWNINGYFTGDGSNITKTDDEFYFIGTIGSDTSGEVQINIDIPSYARVGTLRMRVQANWKGDAGGTKVNLYANAGKGGIGSGTVRDFDMEIVE